MGTRNFSPRSMTLNFHTLTLLVSRVLVAVVHMLSYVKMLCTFTVVCPLVKKLLLLMLNQGRGLFDFLELHRRPSRARRKR